MIGCADPTWLPPEVHVRQVQLDRLVVFCNHSLDSYVLICREHRWVGEVKNCTPSVPVAASRPATGWYKTSVPLDYIQLVAITGVFRLDLLHDCGTDTLNHDSCLCRIFEFSNLSWNKMNGLIYFRCNHPNICIQILTT